LYRDQADARQSEQAETAERKSGHDVETDAMKKKDQNALARCARTVNV
jgi:hypothetical protein